MTEEPSEINFLPDSTRLGSERSRGGVQFPSGGNYTLVYQPASATQELPVQVSRFGVIPKPTVIVRMEEIGVTQRCDALVVLPPPVCHSPELSPTH